MAENSNLLLTYYGDDFSGSTDVMESLATAGLRTILFLSPPRPEVLRKYDNVRAIGVAGISRALASDDMESELTAALSALRSLNAPITQYKVCSTFDSSPEFGSIGRAIEVGQRIFASKFVPLVAGAPFLGRYCIFGNLFASFGQGSPVYRLDRHPSSGPARPHPLVHLLG